MQYQTSQTVVPNSPITSQLTSNNSKACRCGSSTHSRTSSNECRLNKKRKLNTNVTSDTISFINSLNIQNSQFIFTSTTQIGDTTTFINSITQQIINETQINDSYIEAPIYRVNLCKCGASDHTRTNYKYCPLNKKINLSQINTQTLNQQNNIKQCRCGSRDHFRITSLSCPLNKRRINNSQSNQIESIDDLIDFYEAQTVIETNTSNINK